MSRLLLALCLALAPLAAAAQKADATQVDAVSSAAECLAVGLPQKWKQLQVIIALRKPLADDVGVLYMDHVLQAEHGCDFDFLRKA